jgi:hypothetical protein
MADAAPFFPSYRLTQNVDGQAFSTSINMTATGPTAPAFNATTNNAVATQVSQQGNDVVFTVPFSSLGDPAAGSSAYGVWVASYQALLVDSAPGGTGPEQIAQPRYADYTVVRGAA